MTIAIPEVGLPRPDSRGTSDAEAERRTIYIAALRFISALARMPPTAIATAPPAATNAP